MANRKGRQEFFEDKDGLYAESLITWDRLTRFDIQLSDIQKYVGEIRIDQLDYVEDTKGNNGQSGTLIVTNLRLIWQSRKNPAVNLSIGLNQILKSTVNAAQSRLKGRAQALYVHATKEKSSQKYEFIFTHVEPDTPRMFTTVLSVIKAYQSTRLYRELRVRGNFISQGHLQLLEDEYLEENIHGIWNLSGDQGHMGAFYVTNLRVIWYSLLNEQFNMSLPFILIVGIRNQSSKYGHALVLETAEFSGDYLLGFRVDPEERLENTARKLKQLWKVAYHSPHYGVKYEAQKNHAGPTEQGDISVDVSRIVHSSRVEQLEEKSKAVEIEGVGYDEETGLSFQKISASNGETLKSIWNTLEYP